MRLGRELSVLMCAFAALSLTSRSAVAADTRQILFYDPDANQSDIVAITQAFNAFLATVDKSLRLQPVQRQSDFEALLKQSNSAYAIVSSRYLRQTKTAPAVPMLVPSWRGDIFYRKVLIVRGDAPANLSGKSIATTVSATDLPEEKRRVLSSLKEHGIETQRTVVIPVSKDIDALLALAFGQTQAALATPHSLEVLKGINPAAAASFRITQEIEKILRPPLVLVADHASAEDRSKVADAFKKMSADASGQRAMDALGIDQWLPFEPGMWKK